MFPNENSLIGGRYKITEELGKGSFGETYKAQDTGKFNEIVVVKRLQVESFSGDNKVKAKELFEREAEAYKKLGSKHSQIPRLEAYFEETDNFYLVMEYIDESNLSEQELSEGNILEEKSLINLLKNILTIVQVVHSKNLVHRDIKPDNLIRRDSDQEIVLIDFGAVTNDLNIKQKPQTTGQMTNIGNTYAAPEQFRGEAYPCSDIYAVGMISIQALTGRLPVNLPIDPMTGEKLWESLTSASEDLKRVIRKMVDFNTSQRYQSVDEVLKDLDKIDNQSIPVLPIMVILGSLALLSMGIGIGISTAIYKRIPDKDFILKPIERKDMNYLCQNENYYPKKIRQEYSYLKDINDSVFIFKELKLDNSLKKVIPAYRWRCVYEIQGQSKLGEGSSNTITIGLDMDEFICKQYGKDYKATFLQYDDPNSLHCVLTK
ncbi:serine/threonine protein kinase [Plectonema radiosum NIES-515]|uniref:non-specific serine/threonine protein kinase n=1 Tax=Plectonema radiosum NIES-515 TaxID=2986073 RepID=A0ABT3B4I5_9CYAN|nr:serine/threonine-protein kinase [Plectonema radiosum]MCV3216293.1 serine/threonine protein kinase [Plectonema radiosum NIES-515]